MFKPDIDISSKDDYAFRKACGGGKLEVAKWLLEVKPTIDISAENENAFRMASRYGRLEVGKWLQSLFPEKYHIKVEDGQINYMIGRQIVS